MEAVAQMAVVWIELAHAPVAFKMTYSRKYVKDNVKFVMHASMVGS